MTRLVDLDRLSALEKAATPGPWKERFERLCVEFEPDDYVAVGPSHEEGEDGECEEQDEMSRHDASLITEIRNALPAMIEEIRLLRAVARAGAIVIDEAHEDTPGFSPLYDALAALDAAKGGDHGHD